MAHYQVKDPAGQLHLIEGPENASPDEIMSQAQKLIPIDTSPDFGAVVKDAVNEAVAGKGSKIRSLMTDPIAQAKALPYLTGAAGAVTGIPMGASAGTAGGHAIADAALKSYGREDLIPSIGSQLLDTGMAAAGDLTAIPAINRKMIGSAIGNVEKASGVVPPLTDIASKPMALGQKTMGEFINEAVDSLGSDVPKDYKFWAQLKDQVDRIYKLGKDQALTTLDKGRLKLLNSAAQNGINSMVPGRAPLAADLARSQTVPNAITNAYRSLPSSVRTGIGLTAAPTGLGLLYALGKKVASQ